MADIAEDILYFTSSAVFAMPDVFSRASSNNSSGGRTTLDLFGEADGSAAAPTVLRSHHGDVAFSVPHTEGARRDSMSQQRLVRLTGDAALRPTAAAAAVMTHTGCSSLPSTSVLRRSLVSVTQSEWGGDMSGSAHAAYASSTENTDAEDSHGASKNDFTSNYRYYSVFDGLRSTANTAAATLTDAHSHSSDDATTLFDDLDEI